MHNGFIDDYLRQRRELLLAVDPEVFTGIEGTTDSELMFHLALTFGLEEEPLAALERMAGFVEETGRRHGVAEPLQMTVGLSDGERLYAARYASGPVVNSLFVSADASAVRALYPDEERFRNLATRRARSCRSRWATCPGSGRRCRRAPRSSCRKARTSRCRSRRRRGMSVGATIALGAVVGLALGILVSVATGLPLMPELGLVLGALVGWLVPAGPRVSTATLAGVFLIAVPVAFNAAFALLAARFDYPDILRRPTGEVLSRFQAGGAAARAAVVVLRHDGGPVRAARGAPLPGRERRRRHPPGGDHHRRECWPRWFSSSG